MDGDVKNPSNPKNHHKAPKNFNAIAFKRKLKTMNATNA